MPTPTLKVIAVLLNYPDDALQTYAEELVSALEWDGLLSHPQRQQLADFVHSMGAADLMELQAHYIETFDRGRSLSLHLFEHVYGESRDRGQAMVDLKRAYQEAGLDITTNELPDFLPLLLEFCSLIELPDARRWLTDVGHILQLLHARLRTRANRYALVMESLLQAAGLAALPVEAARQVAGEPRDDSAAALDQAWAEQPVSFGGAPVPGCGAQGGATAAPLRRMDPRPLGGTTP